MVVEDNPTTRKMLRVALAAEGYDVLEAPDGRTALDVMARTPPDLILQDLILPDLDGFDLVRRLRDLPGGAEVPIIALSGFPTKREEVRASAAGFTDLLMKPIAPSLLVEIIRTHLPAAPAQASPAGEGRRVLLVDDDPVQLKLARIRLECAGFEVTAAADGEDALAKARLAPPDVVASDVLMPRMDGFRLCLTIRQDPRLAHIPVILTTSSYLEEADRALAERVGASAYVVRTPGLEAVLEALLESLRAGARPPPAVSDRSLDAAHADRLLRQLERQLAMNTGLAQRCSIQAAELSILSGISDALARNEDIDRALAEVLACCLDAGGISSGALYITEPGGRLALRASGGYAAEDAALVGTFFGHADLLRKIIEGNGPLTIPSPEVPAEVARDFLEKAGARSAIVVPLVSRGERFGALLLTTRFKDLALEEWPLFARTLGAEIGQAIGLARAFSRVVDSEAQSRTLVQELQREIDVRRRSERRLATQNAAMRVLSEHAGVEEVAPHFLRAIGEGLGCAAAGLWMLDEKAGVLRLLEAWHQPDPALEEFEAESRRRAFAVGVGLPGRVWQGRRPEWIADVTVDPNFPRAPIALKAGLYAAMGFPIIVGGRLLGVAEVFCRERKAECPDTLATLQGLGGQLGVFLERRSAEQALRERDEQLRQAQKMEAIGRLAGGVAHDFNNLLTAIIGYGDLMLVSLREADPLRRDLVEIKKAATRAASLTQQLLAFSRKQVLEPRMLVLNDVVTGMDRMVRRLIGEDIDLVLDLDPALGAALADPGQVEQVLMNLVVNARDAMPRGGRLTVRTANASPEAAVPSMCGEAPAGPHVVLEVADAGSGIDAETLPHLFEPFFTTKEQGKGTGLGLSTVYGIVSQSGGAITVDSAPGQGTTFRVYLPRVERSRGQPEPAGPAAAPTRGSETVLVVEDEEMVRELTCRTLERNGYRALRAANGGEALLTCERLEGPIHLMVTDVVMPQMSGPELAARLRQVRGEMKVLYMSGYAGDALVPHGIGEWGSKFLPKPFTPDALIRKVREVLDTPLSG
jgi:CheY-like chemotaxis protein